LQRPFAASRVRQFPVGDVLEFHIPANHMAQAFLKRLRAVVDGGDAVRHHFLQARGTVADATEDEMIQPQKLEGQIIPDRLAVSGKRYRELDHVVVDAQGGVATGCIAVAEMAVFVRQHSTKGTLLEVVEGGDAEYQYAMAAILAPLPEAAAF